MKATARKLKLEPGVISASLDAVPRVDETWSDGQPGTGDPFKQLRCTCGGYAFRVMATDDYQTSARCEACGAWYTVHNG